MTEAKTGSQELREHLEEKQKAAEENTPAGMELIGWLLDGWISTHTLMSGLARPIYAYKEELENV